MSAAPLLTAAMARAIADAIEAVPHQRHGPAVDVTNEELNALRAIASGEHEVRPAPDQKELLTVGRDGLQHDAGGSRSSPPSVPLTTEGKEP